MDLNDHSTFERHELSEFQPQVKGVRPALTGDLSAPTQTQLLMQGYPPRPDSAGHPQQYARWIKAVTNPDTILEVKTISNLKTRFGAFVQGPAETSNWTGFVQAPDGFQATDNGLVAIAEAPQFWLYDAYLLAPQVDPMSCREGCNSGIWAGIGGFPFFDIYGGVLTGDLIQSGFHMTDGAANDVIPFVEYAPDTEVDIHELQGMYSGGDTMEIWGWAAGDSMCTPNTSGTFACFGFSDLDKGWTMRPINIPSFVQPISTDSGFGFFDGATVEYVIETLGGNANYGTEYMEGFAVDVDGTVHYDPGGGGSDDWCASGPWVGTHGQVLNYVQWNNGTQDTAADPIVFTENSVF